MGSFHGPQDRRKATWQSDDELTPTSISTEAIRIYKRMRTLEYKCECPEDTSFCDCRYKKEFWDLNAEPNRELRTFSFPVYEDPLWGNSRFQQSAVDRFHVLQAAAKQANKKKSYKFKWER